MRRNSVGSKNGRQATATSPPLGGVSECFRGRSSDSQDQPYLPDFPGVYTQCRFRLSYLLTAAGQLRILTGFPFHSSMTDRDLGMNPLYPGQNGSATLFVVDICRTLLNSASLTLWEHPTMTTACRVSVGEKCPTLWWSSYGPGRALPE
jgi:hypothetical protein